MMPRQVVVMSPWLAGFRMMTWAETTLKIYSVVFLSSGASTTGDWFSGYTSN